MKILYLGPNSSLVDWLQFQDNVVHQKEDKVSHLELEPYDILVSYNYRHKVSAYVLDRFRYALNLHISYLPWNRGADPNFWSIIDNTPKGVTIHKMNLKLDAGDIIAQTAVQEFPDSETLETSYNHLHQEMQKLFRSIWPILFKMYDEAKPQPAGSGSYHGSEGKEFLFPIVCPQGWKTKIGDMKKLYEKINAGDQDCRMGVGGR